MRCSLGFEFLSKVTCKETRGTAHVFEASSDDEAKFKARLFCEFAVTVAKRFESEFMSTARLAVQRENGRWEFLDWKP